MFSTWTPLALAGIGKLPDTVGDRLIVIEMKRKLGLETVERLRRKDGSDLRGIARRLVRWSEDNHEALRATSKLKCRKASMIALRSLGAARRHRRSAGRAVARASPYGRRSAFWRWFGEFARRRR